MKLIRDIFIGPALACALLSNPGLASESDAEKAAVTAAEQWIAIIDRGDYASSWQEASDVFQSAVKQKRWTRNVPLVRDPLGGVITRTVVNVSLIANQPGMNDEQNAIVRFKTSFQNMQSATETIMLTPDRDGRWRVLGYYVTSGYFDLQGLKVALLLLIVIIAAWYLELKPGSSVARK